MTFTVAFRSVSLSSIGARLFVAGNYYKKDIRKLPDGLQRPASTGDTPDEHSSLVTSGEARDPHAPIRFLHSGLRPEYIPRGGRQRLEAKCPYGNAKGETVRAVSVWSLRWEQILPINLRI